MASEVKTNNISPATGTSVTFSGLNVGSDAQGDILYHDGTDYTRLGAGTSGYFLKTQGTSANPVWADARLIVSSCFHPKMLQQVRALILITLLLRQPIKLMS